MESPRLKLKLVTDSSAVSSTIRKNVLGGAFTAFRSSADWKSPSFKLIPFISSTFTDTQLERNYLLDLLFEMRGIAKKDGKENYSLYFICGSLVLRSLLVHLFSSGVPIIFVDMRWGVRDENTCDHMTWVECSRYGIASKHGYFRN